MRAKNLLGRLVTWRKYRDYRRADDKDRPFFHPSDAGLPIVTGPNTDWRWLEQWLPHSTWYMYAVSVGT